MAERWASSPIDEVGRTSVSEQFGRKLIGNCENSRFHVENGAATKGLVDDTAQTRMVWLVHGQHADRERAYPPWHPPAQAGNSAVLAHRERLAVLQNAAGQIAGCGIRSFSRQMAYCGGPGTWRRGGLRRGANRRVGAAYSSIEPGRAAVVT